MLMHTKTSVPDLFYFNHTTNNKQEVAEGYNEQLKD